MGTSPTHLLTAGTLELRREMTALVVRQEFSLHEELVAAREVAEADLAGVVVEGVQAEIFTRVELPLAHAALEGLLTALVDSTLVRRQAATQVEHHRARAAREFSSRLLDGALLDGFRVVACDVLGEVNNIAEGQPALMADEILEVRSQVQLQLVLRSVASFTDITTEIQVRFNVNANSLPGRLCDSADVANEIVFDGLSHI